jgi:hypothetical protein
VLPGPEGFVSWRYAGPFNLVTAHFGVKGVGDLPGVSGKDKQAMAGRYFIDGEAVGRKPLRDSGQIMIGDSKSGGVFCGGKPLMIPRRLRILLRSGERVESCLLRGRRLEQQHHVVQARLSRHISNLKLPACQWVQVPFQGDLLRVIDVHWNAVRQRRGRDGGRRRKTIKLRSREQERSRSKHLQSSHFGPCLSRGEEPG